ncbi:MAG TPA: carboxypeptidase-like regulatory domain-containing protein [Terriglobales bacterium]|nr:carboxypeptidase-like regulatory domain-containing protein [Terriglobales bacterium]
MSALRKFGWLAALLALALPAAAAGKPGSISGWVRDSHGVPQMGAVVEIFSATSPAVRVFTDAAGHYSARELLPGNYSVKVSAASFLPSLREDVPLTAGGHRVVNLTLNTLFEALQLLPQQRPAAQEDDEWKWTLRSAANRPILRLRDDGPLVVVSRSENQDDRSLKAQVVLLAGSDSDGYGGGSDMNTVFNVEQSLFAAGTLSFDGSLGRAPGSPAGALRASYSHRLPDGSRPEIAVSFRRFASPGLDQQEAALQALAVSLRDETAIGNFLEFQYGGEFQAVQFLGRVTAFQPWGSADVHLSPNTVMEYRYATSEPTLRMAKGFDSAPADLSESGPRLSLVGSQPRLERAHHHELSVSRRLGRNAVQVAVYSDRIANTALTGVGDVTADSGFFLPDVYSGTFTYNGGELGTRGVRAVVQRKFSHGITATVDYAYGGVLALDGSNLPWEQALASLHRECRHSAALKLAGAVPGSHTRWIASYRWVSGDALTPVDMFNASPGQTDPYLSLFLRQPLPQVSFLPGHVEALVDLRNLLAEGYVPVLGQDGHTIYLVQSARSVRGGLAFNF